MGSHFKRAIFNEHVQERIAGWQQKIKNKKGQKAENQSGQGSSHEGSSSSSAGIQLGSIFQKRASAPENNTSVPKADEIN